MINRCYNPKIADYQWYGGRGIKVCDEWLGENGFQHFYDWAIENKYDAGAKRGITTLDIIEVNCNYEPTNCR